LVNLNNENKNIIILGGGIPGIFSALYLAKKHPQYKVHLVESSEEIGGLYNSFEDKEAGIFDKGMHIIYETCIKEVDEIIRNCLPKNEWLFLEGNSKDIAGVYHNNLLETNSPYVNIDSIKKRNINRCLSELFLSLKNIAPNFLECNNAEDFFEKRFGKSITKELIEPIIKKLWRTPLKKLHPASTRIVLMDRIRIFEEESVADLMQSKFLKSRIAFPNQMKLNQIYRNSQRGLYPKNFGMYNLIKGMEKKLNELGVKVYKKSNIESIQIIKNEIKSVSINIKNSKKELSDIKLFHSTIPSSKLFYLFGLKPKNNNFDKGLNQKYLFLLIDSPPNMGNIYYFHSFQKGHKTYRVTNYAAYCPSSVRIHKKTNKKVWPICVELHYKNQNPNFNNIFKDGVKELIQTKIIESKNSIIFSRVESAGGFPLLTIKNCNLLRENDNILKNLNLENLLIAGQAPDRGIFFLHDILENIFESIKKI
tara:strand:+ start:1211 stop:2647 length:1437 start_codon:yes stop_codon:yes gene_type:complete